MKSWAENQGVWNEAQKLLLARKLKCCSLCGAINAVSNSECFVCGWHGRFDHDRVQIEREVHLLLDRSPDLARALIENSVPDEPKKTWLERFAMRFVAIIRSLRKERK